jgi:precorrin-6y C5,15-methyltransferase (decarboxylating) CbiE subunit
VAGKVLVISCGPGGKNFITLEALKKIERCQILIGSERLLSTFAPSGKKQIVLTGSMENLELTLKEHQTKTVGILVTGDAGLYSLAKKVLTLCECVEIVPGVSSLQAAFARLGQSWDNVETFSFHGRPFDCLDRLCQAQKAVVFCDLVNSAKAILKKLLPHRLNQRYFICQNLTLNNEKVIEVKSHEELQKVDEVSTELLVILREENE